jgi:hypothetical protein
MSVFTTHKHRRSPLNWRLFNRSSALDEREPAVRDERDAMARTRRASAWRFPHGLWLTIRCNAAGEIVAAIQSDTA